MQFTITRAHVEQMIKTLEDKDDAVIANRGKCKYSNPCIIGSIMPQEFVDYLISIDNDDEPVDSLCNVDYDYGVNGYFVKSAQEFFDTQGCALDEVINELKRSIGE